MSMGGAVFLSKDIQCGRNESRMLPILALCFLFLRNTIIYIKEITSRGGQKVDNKGRRPMFLLVDNSSTVI